MLFAVIWSLQIWLESDKWIVVYQHDNDLHLTFHLAGNSGRRFAAAKAEALGRIGLEETEESDSELDDDVAGNLNDRLGGNSDSDVTVDEWQNELRTWEVGASRNPDKESKLIRPTLPAHVVEDDF